VTAINDSAVLVRGLDVTARLTNSVENLSAVHKDGVLLETLIGRYVLDRDAREPWLLIDGVRCIAEIAAAVADGRGAAATEILPAVRDFCAALVRLGLVEVVSVGETGRVEPAVAGQTMVS
jgi:hypothetical protein